MATDDHALSGAVPPEWRTQFLRGASASLFVGELWRSQFRGEVETGLQNGLKPALQDSFERKVAGA